MRSARRAAGCLLGALGVFVLHAGCGSSHDSVFDGGPGSGEGGLGGDGTLGDSPSFGGDGSGACGSSADCPGGVCIASTGTCCADAQHVCGGACCTGGSVCLFDACVVPGNACHTSNDCGPGQYCEPALGDGGDAGTAPADAGCTQSLPVGGRCLPLPPTCPGDAGVPADGGTCIESCEYHPPSGGALNAIPKWTWGNPTATQFPDFTDVWSTPTIARIHDNNCDGKVDELDSPSIVFVSGKGIDATTGKGTCCQCTNTTPTACHTGVLRLLDGGTGKEVWSLDKASASSVGFEGFSNAIGDIDGDGYVDIVAVTGEGYLVLVDRNGVVKATSDKPIPNASDPSFGWGGGLAVADIDLDGHPEIAWANTVFTTKNGGITLAWTGTGGGGGGGIDQYTSTFVDLDGAADGNLELLAGNTAYKSDGTVLWNEREPARRLPWRGRLQQGRQARSGARLGRSGVDPRRSDGRGRARAGDAAGDGQRGTADGGRLRRRRPAGDRRGDGDVLLGDEAELHDQDDRRPLEDGEPRPVVVGHRVDGVRLRGRRQGRGDLRRRVLPLGLRRARRARCASRRRTRRSRRPRRRSWRTSTATGTRRWSWCPTAPTRAPRGWGCMDSTGNAGDDQRRDVDARPDGRQGRTAASWCTATARTRGWERGRCGASTPTT